jgi:hypothetical protein
METYHLFLPLSGGERNAATDWATIARACGLHLLRARASQATVEGTAAAIQALRRAYPAIQVTTPQSYHTRTT